jgi:nucleoside-diphosphate-sugar epimerase
VTGRARDGVAGLSVLVTGAGGFVGAVLCRRLLAEGARVHAVVRPGGDLWRLEAIAPRLVVHEVDVRDFAPVQEVVAATSPSLVYHAARHSAYDSSDALGPRVATDVLGTAHLLDALRELGEARIVLLGSSLAYQPLPRPLREDDPLTGVDVRGGCKAAQSLLVRHAAAGGLDAVELRLFHVYGPWEHPHRFVPRAIRAALLDEELPLTPPGLTHDPVFVEDVAEACLLAAARPLAYAVMNVAGGRAVSNEELVASVERVTGRRIRVRPVALAPRPADRPVWCADVSRARELLGWRPTHSLEEGLAGTAAWMEERLRHG